MSNLSVDEQKLTNVSNFKEYFVSKQWSRDQTTHSLASDFCMTLGLYKLDLTIVLYLSYYFSSLEGDFVCFHSLRPINNLSISQGRVFLC